MIPIDEAVLKNAPSRKFWEGCNARKLLLSECTDCDTVFYYPRRVCPSCGGLAVGSVESSGKGAIFTFTKVHMSFYGEKWKSELPYFVVLVRLDEGPTMLSRIVDRPGDERVRIGARVEVFFDQRQEQALPLFRLVDQQ